MPAFIDSRSYDGPAEIRCDVCVAGSGAAGITLARELSGRKLSVVVLESGGLEIDGATQLLYDASNSGLRYPPLTSNRLRYFGGTTNHWGGRTNFMSPRDFEPLPGMELPGWPIARDEMLPYFERAATMLDLPYDLFDAGNAVRSLGHEASELVEARSDRVDTTTYIQSPVRRLAPTYRAELEGRSSLRVFLYANVTHVQLLESGTAVDHLLVRTLDGRSLRVRAKAFVLACHAVENARLLLASNDVQKSGIGNQSDQVGRNFMDHVYVVSGKLLTSTEMMPRFYMRGWKQRGDTRPELPINFSVAINDETRRREGILAYYMRFHLEYADEDVYRSLSYLKSSFFKPFDSRVLSAIGEVVGDLGASGRIAREEAGLREREIGFLRVHERIEQAPNASSRITLTDERDALGMPKINLHWAITDLDIFTFQRGQEIAIQELSALGYGRFVIERKGADFIRETLGAHHHHMGTTRMSRSASHGVVDPDCRVHGVQNLYVAGSGVWPRGGRTGPTFGIVVFAIRLADHLVEHVKAA